MLTEDYSWLGILTLVHSHIGLWVHLDIYVWVHPGIGVWVHPLLVCGCPLTSVAPYNISLETLCNLDCG